MNDRRVLVLLLSSSLVLHPGCNCDGGPDCPAGDGTGDLTVDITVPPGFLADVVVTAPDGSIMNLVMSDTLAGVADGGREEAPVVRQPHALVLSRLPEGFQLLAPAVDPGES